MSVSLWFIRLLMNWDLLWLDLRPTWWDKGVGIFIFWFELRHRRWWALARWSRKFEFVLVLNLCTRGKKVLNSDLVWASFSWAQVLSSFSLLTFLLHPRLNCWKTLGFIIGPMRFFFPFMGANPVCCLHPSPFLFYLCFFLCLFISLFLS